MKQPLTNYTKSKSNKDGLAYSCKECALKYRIKRRDYNKAYTVTNKVKMRAYDKIYSANNREKHNKQRRDKRKNDPAFKLKEYTRNRINECVKLFQYKKLDNTLDALGCSISHYIKHIESKWSDDMHWGNYGEYWEIDHIHPLSKGGSFNWQNTQPLTVKENRIKSDKLIRISK